MSKSSPVLFAAAMLAIVYAGMAVALPAGAFFSAEEGVRYLQIDSLWNWRSAGSAAIDGNAALDPDGEYAPPGMNRTDATFVSRYPPIFPLLASFPHLLFGVRGALVIPALAAILCMAFTARLAVFVMPRHFAGLAGAAAAVTTPLVVRGAMLRDETLAALLLTAGLIPICKAAGSFAAAGSLAAADSLATAASAEAAGPGADPAPGAGHALRLALVGGVFLGLAGAACHAAFLVTPAVVVAGLIVFGVARFGLHALAIAAGAAAVAVPRALYHGSWLPVPPPDQPRFAGALTARILPQMARPWFAGACILLALLWLFRRPLSSRLHRTVIPALSALLAAALLAAGPLATILATVTESPLSARQRGLGSLMNVMPFMALLPLMAIPGRGPAFPHRKFLSIAVLLYVVSASALFPVPNGLTWGPAILIPVAGVIAMVMMGALIDRREQPGGRLAIVLLWAAVAIGVAVQGVGLRFVASVRSYNAAILERVKSSVAEGGVILTDLPDIPFLLASLSPETPCLVVRQGADLESLADRIEEASKTSFWIVRSKSRPLAAGGTQIDLGAGLALLRHEAEAGVRGFMRVPAGD